MEFLTTVVGSLAGKAIDYTVDPIARQVGYLFNYKSKCDELKAQLEELKVAREQVQRRVDDAKRNGDDILDRVETWLTEVNRKISAAEQLVEDETEAKKRCFSRLCPNFKSRYQLSKKAVKDANSIDELLKREGRFENVSHCPAPEGMAPVKGYEEFESRRGAFDGVMEALKDANLSLIGVYGMGGVGKTTLVKQVASQAKEKKWFDYVVMAAVTQTPNMLNVQKEIAEKLGMEKFDEKSFMDVRAGLLSKRLREEKSTVLIILDDIWSPLNLDELGVPSDDQQMGCKILMTSRRLDLLESMGSQKNLAIEILTKEEAWNLFQNMAGDIVGRSEIRPTAVEIAQKCAGLPIAIVTVAKALKHKKELFQWKNALEKLNKPSKGDDVYKAIMLSYTFLEEEVQKTFLLCSIMGHDAAIEDLLIYCIGFGLFNDLDTIQKVRDRVLTLVSDLKDSSLLLSSSTPGCFDMHDVVRDVAVSIASSHHHWLALDTKEVSQYLSNEQTKQNCNLIRFQHAEVSGLPDELECSNLTFFSMGTDNDNRSLFSFNDRSSLKIPNNFFKGMRKLKFLYFSEMRFSSLPFSTDFHLSKTLRTLYLFRCKLEDIGIIGGLTNLEILSLRRSKIKMLPKEMVELTKLKLLDLTRCYFLKVIPANVLSGLSRLEELYLYGSFDRWEVVDEGRESPVGSNASRVEDEGRESPVGSNASLVEDWGCESPVGSNASSDSWETVDEGRGSTVGSNASRVEDEGRESPVGSNASLVEDEGCESPVGRNASLGESPVGSNASRVEDEGRESPVGSNASPVEDWGCEIFVGSNASFDSWETVDEGRGSTVGSNASLVELKNLSHLTILEVHVPNVKAMPKDTTFFGKLERYKISIGRCKLDSYDYERECLMMKTSRMLRLSDRGDKMFDDRLLMKVDNLCLDDVNDVTNLERISYGELNVESFSQLRVLEISRCEKLKNLFSFSIAKELHQLEEIDVFCCENITELIAEQEEETLKFDKLNSLKLESLPKLIRLFDQKVALPMLEVLKITKMENLERLWPNQLANEESFPKLTQLRLKMCHKLMNVFPLSMSRRLQRLETLVIDDCELVEEIFEPPLSIQAQAENIITFEFPRLTNLELIHLPNLKSFYHQPYTINLSSLKKELRVDGCDKVEILFAASLPAKTGEKKQQEIPIQQPLFCLNEVSFTNLEEVSMKWNDGVEEIWHDPRLLASRYLCSLKVVRIESFPKEMDTFPSKLFQFLISLPNLQHLDIQNAYSKQILEDVQEKEGLFQNLKDSKVRCCPNLKDNLVSSSLSFQNLVALKVFSCDGIINLVKHSIAKSLVQLQEMRISFCDRIEEIIEGSGDDDDDDEDGEVKDELFQFPQLKLLELVHLPNLGSFCSSGNFIFQFPSLQTVIVERCPSMKVFSQGDSYTPMLHKVKLSSWEDEECWLGSLNSTIQEMFKEKESFGDDEDDEDFEVGDDEDDEVLK